MTLPANHSIHFSFWKSHLNRYVFIMTAVKQFSILYRTNTTFDIIMKPNSTVRVLYSKIKIKLLKLSVNQILVSIISTYALNMSILCYLL